MCLPQIDIENVSTDQACDLVGQIVEDVKITVTQAVEPVETGFTNINDKFQENVSKMNDKLQDNVHKINENFNEKVHKWGGRKSEEVVKEGTYLVTGDNKEDAEIVQTEEHVRVEHDADDKDGPSVEPGAVKEEVSGTTTSRSANEDIPGEETISFTQQKEKSGSSEKKVTNSRTKETDDRGRFKKDESMDVKEKYQLNSQGGVASKETVAHKVERNDSEKVVSEEMSEEKEERDERGRLLKKKVMKDGEEKEIEDHLHDTS
jgi:hypothetical protein